MGWFSRDASEAEQQVAAQRAVRVAQHEADQIAEAADVARRAGEPEAAEVLFGAAVHDALRVRALKREAAEHGNWWQWLRGE